MTERFNKERIERVSESYKVDKDTAVYLIESYDAGIEAGRKKGQAEAQRFFRLALGMESPTTQEKVYWNQPVPLKEEEADD